MVSLKAATMIIQQTFPKDTINTIVESPSHYIFGITSVDEERIGRDGYDAVNKNTGKVEYVKIVDFIELNNNKLIKAVK